MRLIEEIIKYQYPISLQIDDSLLRIAQKTFKESYGKPQEPDFIASLVLDFTPELYDILKAFLPGFNFNITSIFAHQKPTVNIGTTKNPELGDLLIVFMHTDANNRKWLNSLLFQAKMTTHNITRIAPTDEHQLKLYVDWPRFTYANSSSILKGQPREVKPHTVHDGAQYLMIDKNPDAASGRTPEFPMACAVPDKTVVIDRPLNIELVNFFKFKSGRTFEDRNEITEDWSQIIWDLLDLSKALYSKRNNSGRSGFPRQFQTGYVPRSFWEHPEHIKAKEPGLNNEEQFSVPVIVIESAENIG